MTTLRALELKAFVPARDHALSKRFYQDMGFTLASDEEGTAYLHHGEVSFLLEDSCPDGLAQHLMLHLLVDDVDGWWQRLQQAGLVERYGVTLGPVRLQPWRMRDFLLTDPSGVRWLIAQNV